MTAPSEDYRLIPLTQGQFAKVDIGDYDWLMRLKWSAQWSKPGKTFYAVRGERRGGKGLLLSMHRSILGLLPGDKRHVDHINHDTLDNRRSNLRAVQPSQNALNRGAQSNNTSGFKGVSRTHTGRWRASIRANGKDLHLGCFDTPEQAHSAYVDACKKHHGEFGRVA